MIEVDIRVSSPPLCPFCGEPLAAIKCTEDYEIVWDVKLKKFVIPDESRDLYPPTCASCGESGISIISLLYPRV